MLCMECKDCSYAKNGKCDGRKCDNKPAYKKNSNSMDAVKFIEEVIGVKLYDYQKEMIKYVEEHPDYKIIYPRGRERSFESTPNLLGLYMLYKISQKED